MEDHHEGEPRRRVHGRADHPPLPFAGRMPRNRLRHRHPQPLVGTDGCMAAQVRQGRTCQTKDHEPMTMPCPCRDQRQRERHQDERDGARPDERERRGHDRHCNHEQSIHDCWLAGSRPGRTMHDRSYFQPLCDAGALGRSPWTPLGLAMDSCARSPATRPFCLPLSA